MKQWMNSLSLIMAMMDFGPAKSTQSVEFLTGNS